MPSLARRCSHGTGGSGSPAAKTGCPKGTISSWPSGWRRGPMLTDREGFAVALHRLAAFHSKALDAATVDDYWRLLQPELDDQQFRQACAALAAGDWWPTPARVLRAARFAAPFAWRSAIGRLYSAVRACDEFGPTGGTTYRAERVRQQCGDLGARLFSAVGGAAAGVRGGCCAAGGGRPRAGGGPRPAARGGAPPCPGVASRCPVPGSGSPAGRGPGARAAGGLPTRRV